MNIFRFNQKYYTDLKYNDPGRKIRKDIGFLEFNHKLLEMAIGFLNEIDFPKMNLSALSNAIKFCTIVRDNLTEFLRVRWTVQVLKQDSNRDIYEQLEDLISNLATVSDTIYNWMHLTDLKIQDPGDRSEIIMNQPIQLPYTGEPINEYMHDVAKIMCPESGFYTEIQYLDVMQGVSPKIMVMDDHIEIKITSALDALKEHMTSLAESSEDIDYQEIDYIEELKSRNVLVHVPFQSYQMVLDSIDQMCQSPEIKTIYMSLYRVAKDSRVIKSLIDAAKLGKQLYLYIEVLARGNELRNIEIIQELRQYPNVFINWSYHGLKVHGKMFAAISDNGDIYWHTGTGNYNEDTAKYYTDIHYIGMSRRPTGLEVSRGEQIVERLEAVIFEIIDPMLEENYAVRQKLLDLIYYAREEHLDLRIKCNNINDPEVIDELVKAAEEGCHIKIIARTIIGIIPHENIEIVTIIGKYLEHERIYIAGDTNQGDDTIAVIGSADLLYRNLSKRVEFLTVVDPADVEIIETIFNDNWELGKGDETTYGKDGNP